MNKSYAIAASLAVLALSACTGGSPQTGEPPAGVNRPSTTATASTTTPGSAVVEKPAPTDDGTVQFGKTYTWDSGISVTVSAPKAFKPSQFAAGNEPHKNNVVVTVTLVNKSGKAFDPTMVSVTAQSTNEEANMVFDMDSGVGGAPQTRVLNNRETTFKAGFNVADPKDVIVQVTPDWNHEPVVFTP